MKKIITSFLLIFLVSIAIAQVNKSSKGIAVNGYDPVSYFQKKPLEGKSSIKVKFKDATYLFASEENKKAFIANPSKYLPIYGGYCAYAMGFDGSLVDIDPETFKIINGKLYLFYNQYFNNTKEKWDKDERNLMKKADENWSKN